MKKPITSIQEVQGIKEIRARTYDNHVVVDVVILVERDLGLEKAHDNSTLVEKSIKEKDGSYNVHVYVELNLQDSE